MATTTDMAPTRSNGSKRPSQASRSRRSRTDDLGAQVEQLQADLKSVAASISRLVENQADGAQRVAKKQAARAINAGAEAVEEVQDEFGHLEKQMKDTIRQRPLTAVAGAIALGFVLAVISR